MKPTFPLKIVSDDGEVQVLEDLKEVGAQLEWFDSEDGDDSRRVFDAADRPVHLKVVAFKIEVCEVRVKP